MANITGSITKIRTSDNNEHYINAKYWDGHEWGELASVLKYCGITTTKLTDGATTNPVVIGGTNHTATAGCVVFYEDTEGGKSTTKEFVFNGSKWELLGADSTYKVIQSTVSSPNADGSAVAFIDTISQDANGVITVSKKNVDFSNVVKPNDLKTINGESIVGSGDIKIESSSTYILPWMLSELEVCGDFNSSITVSKQDHNAIYQAILNGKHLVIKDGVANYLYANSQIEEEEGNRIIINFSYAWNMSTFMTLDINSVDGVYKLTVNYDFYDEEKVNLTRINYSTLKVLRDSEELVPGMQYRITDYETTTTQANTISAQHQFDIIVTADTANTLNEIARACLHKGDTYFSNAGAKLEAWQIWYCLDNDNERFAWADTTNGKGVIYRMIDEWNNDCPYDFKNIKFKNPMDEDDLNYYYTFNRCTSSGHEDMSVILVDTNNIGGKLYPKQQVTNNIISTAFDTGNTRIHILNFIIFIEKADFHYEWDDYLVDEIVESFYNNKFSINCVNMIFENSSYNNIFGEKCKTNIFKELCYNNTFGNDCQNNTFGNNCYNNTFGNQGYYNTFGNNCQNNTFGNQGYYNTFGNNCQNNTFGNNCESNTFGNNCVSNTFGNNCESNTFVSNCVSNTFGNSCYNNTFGDICYNNTFGNNCESNTFGNNCESNTFVSNCVSNTFGNSCYNNTFGDYCNNNTFGDDCESNTFGNNCDNNTFVEYCYNNTFGDDCLRNTFKIGCDSNTFKMGCSSNTFGIYCYYNTFGNNCESNTFGNNCVSNTFGNSCDNNTFGNTYNNGGHYYRYFELGDGTKYVIFASVGDASSNNYVQNYKIYRGLQGNSSNTITVSLERNLSYEMKIAKNSKGEVKIYCEADLIA